MNFKRFLSIMEQTNGGIMVEDHSDIMSSPVFLPHLKIDLPTVTKSGKIAMIVKDKNPILLQMSDETRLYFSHDQYKRINGTPAIGRNITVVFQRRPNDKSKMVSQIDSCTVT